MTMHLYTAAIWSKMYNNVKMYNIEVNAKCRHLKKFYCNGTLRQVFITVVDWRYPISCVHSVILVF
jgi:hypothetical protein